MYATLDGANCINAGWVEGVLLWRRRNKFVEAVYERGLAKPGLLLVHKVLVSATNKRKRKSQSTILQHVRNRQAIV